MLSVQVKNWIGGVGFIVLLLGAAAYGAWSYWPASRAAALKALATDVSTMDAAQMEAFVRGLPIDLLTWDEKLALMEKLRARFDLLPPSEKMKLMTKVGEAMEKEPESPLMKNGRELFRAAFRKQMKEYMAADPAARKDLLDKQIDEQDRREAMRKLAEAAKGLLGGGDGENAPAAPAMPGPALRDDNAIRHHIADAMADSMKNGTPEDRASATQYFTDMRARRIERGLPTRF